MLPDNIETEFDVESQRQARRTRADATTDRWQIALNELRSKRYVDLTKDTQFSQAWMIIGILLFVAGLAVESRFATAVAICLFVVAGAGWTWNWLSLFGLHYSRRLSEERAFMGETIELHLEVSNRKFLPVLWLRVIDVFPGTLPVEAAGGAVQEVRINRTTNWGEFTSFWSAGAFGRLRRSFKVHCVQRGYHAYGPATLATGDGFGMFSRTGTLPERQFLIIYPKLYTVAELDLPAKNPFGERAAETRLVEDPLLTAGIRAWRPADGLKRVHWKATARHGTLLSRLYEPSQETQVLIFLNVATMTRHWLGNIPELMERAISVAGSLASLCTELRLPVGLIANGHLPGSDQPLRLLPGRSPGQLVRILELLAAVTGFAAQPIEELLLRESPRLPWGATLAVVTAIAHEELLATLIELNRAGRRVVLFTLAERPPEQELPGITVYHLPHLVEDVIAPTVHAAD